MVVNNTELSKDTRLAANPFNPSEKLKLERYTRNSNISKMYQKLDTFSNDTSFISPGLDF